MPSETHSFAETPVAEPTRVDLAREWVRRRLFDGVWNSLLTILCVAFLVWAIPPAVDWLFLSAVWGSAEPAACRGAEGACWAMVPETYRRISFGR